MKRIFLINLISIFLLSICPLTAFSQTDIHISGPKSGFPVAVPQLCDQGGASEQAAEIPSTIIQNLRLSGLFNVINPNAYIEAKGKCIDPNQVAFSDWTVIGAEGLVRGEVKPSPDGKTILARLYLYDVLQQKIVIGKQYEAGVSDSKRIAHRFSNEIMRFFTGEPGIFGTRIAFISKVGRFKELFMMDLDGSNIRQLTKDRGLVMSPAWSPDGSKVAYTSYATKWPELYMMSASGGSVQRITQREGLELGAEFSPDGGKLLSSASEGGASHLVEFGFSGRMLRRLTSGDVIDVSPSYSPNGSEIVFCSNRGGGPQIYIMQAGGGQPKRISYTSSNYCTSPSWSPKGDKIVFVCLSGGNQLFMVSPQGGQATQLTYSGNNEDPSWSPDGNYVAFSSDFGQRRARSIAILPLSNLSPVQISTAAGGGGDSQPAWSPRVE